LHYSRLADQPEQGRVIQPVMDVSSLTARQKDARFSQGHQMLREVRLPPAKCGFKVADASLALTNRQQDLQPGGLADGL